MGRIIVVADLELRMTSPKNHKFDPQDLATYLKETFEASPMEPLQINVAPPATGVYALYWKGQIVYIGKALATGKGVTLRRRLNEHYTKISTQSSIPVEEMTCRWLVMEDDFMIDASESYLRREYLPAWDGSGFGSHVPGRGRPGYRGPSRWEREHGTKPPSPEEDEQP